MPEMIAGHVVQCKSCGDKTIVDEGQNVHDALNCRCCPGDHKHAGPDGQTQDPCRGVVIHANAVVGLALGAVEA